MPDFFSITRRKFLSDSAALAAATSIPAGALAQDGIQTRAIPRTGERLPLIGLGSPNFFYTTPEGGNNDSAKEVIRTMYEMGGRMIDTPAFFRPDPPVLGPILQEMSLQNELFLSGKLTFRNEGREAAIQHVNTTIENMGRQQLDLMLLLRQIILRVL